MPPVDYEFQLGASQMLVISGRLTLGELPHRPSETRQLVPQRTHSLGI